MSARDVAADDLRIVPDPSALGRAAAQLFRSRVASAVEARGRAAVALSGGSTPGWLFRSLVEESPGFDWTPVHFFWGDERTVPPGHPDSNYGAARRELLDPLGIREVNVHRIRGEASDPGRAARDYEAELRRFFEPRAAAWPRFDLILLGLGPDGHTASLFPGTPALQEEVRWVVANPVPRLDTVRVTLTLPLIQHARTVVFLVEGEEKAAILREVLEGPRVPAKLPAQAVRPVAGELHWLVDAAAAKRLTR